jgi:hypothetical protein
LRRRSQREAQRPSPRDPLRRCPGPLTHFCAQLIDPALRDSTGVIATAGASPGFAATPRKATNRATSALPGLFTIRPVMRGRKAISAHRYRNTPRGQEIRSGPRTAYGSPCQPSVRVIEGRRVAACSAGLSRTARNGDSTPCRGWIEEPARRLTPAAVARGPTDGRATTPTASPAGCSPAAACAGAPSPSRPWAGPGRSRRRRSSPCR